MSVAGQAMNSRLGDVKFPRHILNPRNSQSLAVRVAHLSRYLAFKRPPGFPKSCGVQSGTLTYLTLTCANDLLMTRVSLSSLLRHASEVPRLIVAYDESLTHESIQEAFSDWPGNIETYSRQDTFAFFSDAGKQSLAEFSDSHIFGYKFAACVRAATNGRLVYADGDILWFGDVVELSSRYRELPIYPSSDRWNSIDPRVKGFLPPEIWGQISTIPSTCAGFMIWNNAAAVLDSVQEPLSSFLQTHCPERFTEQTFVGVAAVLCGANIPLADVDMICPGTATLGNRGGEPPFAGHYPTVNRPQFWIDRFHVSHRRK